MATFKHLEDLTKPGQTRKNFYNINEVKGLRNYDDNGNSSEAKLVREEDGLITLKNGGMLKLQAKVASSVMKQIAKNIFTGSLTGLNMPIELFEPNTYLQQSVISFGNLPTLMKELFEKNPNPSPEQ